jgi:hypothetical protein
MPSHNAKDASPERNVFRARKDAQPESLDWLDDARRIANARRFSPMRR